MFAKKAIIPGKELEERVKWFIDLRWVAAFSLFLVISGAGFVLHIDLAILPLYAGGFLLLLCNMVFLSYYNVIISKEHTASWHKKIYYFANAQVLLDLIILTYFIHFSGGIENPFVFYFVFHMVIASILLSNLSAYVHATFVVFILGITTAGEFFGVLNHYHLNGFLSGELFFNWKYTLGNFAVIASTLYMTVFMTTSVVNNLREEEKKLADANKLLAEQDRLKSQYVLTVSHDLRSSISTIESCVNLVLQGLTGPITEKTKEILERAEQRSRNLISFVKDLLDLSSIRADKNMEKSIVSLSEVAGKAVEALRYKMDQKKLKFEMKDSLAGSFALVNLDAMERVFVNLLENAIRYTPSGGRIELKLIKNDDILEVCVKDTGIGIAEEDQRGLFRDFFRAANARMLEKDGTGLGLSIVKHIIESHNGKIWLESRLGIGSSFTFSIPVFRGAMKRRVNV